MLSKGVSSDTHRYTKKPRVVCVSIGISIFSDTKIRYKVRGLKFHATLTRDKSSSSLSPSFASSLGFGENLLEDIQEKKEAEAIVRESAIKKNCSRFLVSYSYTIFITTRSSQDDEERGELEVAKEEKKRSGALVKVISNRARRLLRGSN